MPDCIKNGHTYWGLSHDKQIRLTSTTEQTANKAKKTEFLPAVTDPPGEFRYMIISCSGGKMYISWRNIEMLNKTCGEAWVRRY